jgi:5-methylcytosine-specific restriction enzyme subunit McrC
LTRILHLREHELCEAVALTADELAVVSGIPSVSVTVSRTPGLFDIRPGSTIGMITSDLLTVEIKPKLPIERVMFLMSHALDPKAFRMDTPDASTAPTIHEAIIPAFVHHVRAAVRQGVLQGYRTREEALSSVRGRIRISDQAVRRFGIAPPIEVTFDDFTEDIDENRILRAALYRLHRLPIRSAASRQMLSALEPRFSAVSLVDYQPKELPEFIWTRLNDRYRPAVALAELILTNTALAAELGPIRARGFLVDMNRVFENFVVVALREALGLSTRQFRQGDGRLRLDTARRVVLKPDISWWQGSRCVFVGDVKYKKIRVDGVLHPDLYQLLAYTTATNLDDGLLIYAAGEDEDVVHSVAHVGKQLRVTTLDLAGSIPELFDQIDGVAERVHEMAV